MKNLLNKYKEIILYIFFGVCTTLVNIIVYYACSHILFMNTTSSTIISWILSVTFAYVTNKLWVFESINTERKRILKEILSFYGCRLTTGIMDLGLMIIFVDILHCNDMLIKILSNILVIILNYVASKVYIFNDKKKNL